MQEGQEDGATVLSLYHLVALHLVMYNALSMDAPYLNFDLAIEQTEEGAFCRITQSPKGTALAPFITPLNGHALAEFWRLLGEPTANNPELLAEQHAAARDVGTKLFQAAMAGDLRGRLHGSLQTAYQERTRLRIRLNLDKMPQAANLPWEYLFDPTNGQFLASSIHSPLMRYIDLMHQIRPIVVEPPLRILMVIASPTNHAPIYTDREWFNLVDTLDYLALEGKLVLERLREPTLFSLQRQLRQKDYHIVHFVGHGAYDTQSQDGLLLFEDERRAGRLVSGQHLGSMLREHFALRLVLLDIRDGARDAKQHPFLSAANRLVHKGISAAVALRSELPAGLASVFVNNFYPHIAQLAPVDVAMGHARQALQTASSGLAWAQPVLYTRASDGWIFDDGTWHARKDAEVLARQPSPISENLRIRYLT